MKNESVIEHSCTQEIWNKIRFQIFEGRKNEKENLFYVQNFILSNIIRHILDYRRFLFFSMVSEMSSFEDEHVLQKVCRTNPSSCCSFVQP